MSITGRCLCGQIQYEFESEPTLTGICHCTNCQRQAGSAYSTLAGVPKAEFKLTQGELKLYQDSDTDSGNSVQRYFCGNCGSPIYSAIESQAEMLFLKTGTLDDNSQFKPMFHAWAETKQPWVQLDDGVPVMPRG